MKHKLKNLVKTLWLLPSLSLRYFFKGVVKGKGIKHAKSTTHAILQGISHSVDTLKTLLEIEKRGTPENTLSSFHISPTNPHQTPIFSHSGNAGDIVFACLLLKSLWLHSGKKVRLHLQTNVPVVYSVKHPLNNTLMSEKVARQLAPALQIQPYIAEITIGPEFPENGIKLDAFRQFPIDLRTGLIQGWYQLYTEHRLNIFDPWIHATELPEYANTIVVSRTGRLRSDYIDYTFLSKYADNLLFVGLPEEIASFQVETGITCPTLTAKSFDHLFNIINSCRLFIGNQGFPYSIAESVQCPRVLETNSIAPNNYPMSANGRVALFQEQFENCVYSLLKI